jgi:hypothetical protein
MKPNVSQNPGERVRLVQSTHHKFHFKRRLPSSGCCEGGGGQYMYAVDGNHDI